MGEPLGSLLMESPMGSAVSSPPLLVDDPEARRLLGGLCAKTMYNLRRDGLPHVKIGSRVMYDLADLRAFIERRKEVANG
jgi:hypothetical protein